MNKKDFKDLYKAAEAMNKSGEALSRIRKIKTAAKDFLDSVVTVDTKGKLSAESHEAYEDLIKEIDKTLLPAYIEFCSDNCWYCHLLEETLEDYNIVYIDPETGLPMPGEEVEEITLPDNEEPKEE